MADFTPESLESAFSGKYPLDESAAEVIESIKEFSGQFNQALFGNLDTTKTEAFRFEDPIQFLLDENKLLPANVTNAIMAASYKWMVARGGESLFNDTKDMIRLMGLPDDHPINRTAFDLLGTAGIYGTLLQESLGSEIYQLLGIQETDTADHSAKNKLELSLGLQAISTLQVMGMLEQTDVLPWCSTR